MKYRKMSVIQADINTALVLSGGGAKGAYQVGVIRELFRRGISFELITGTSIGALNAALVCEFIYRGMSKEEICMRLEKAWLSFDGLLSLNWSGFLKNIFSISSIPSVYSNKNIKKTLASYIPAIRRFSDYSKCQLSVTGTNLSRRKLNIFDYNSTTPVVDAVLASMSYPVALPAVKIDGDFFVDGGALCNAPLKEAIQWGAGDIYLVFLRPLDMMKEPGNPEDEDFDSALDIIEEFLDMATNNLMYGDLKRADKINQMINLLNKYQNRLPQYFLQEMRKILELKYQNGRREIKVIEIAPFEVLVPPGIKGFDQKEAIKSIVKRGEMDTAAILD